VDQVAIIMPLEYRIDFFISSYKASNTDMMEWVDQLIEGCDPANKDGAVVRDLERVCVIIAQRRKQARHFTDGLRNKVMLAGLRLKDDNLCFAALEAVVKRLPQPETTKLIERFRLDKLKSR
jgi:hypothetical protein